MATQKSSAPIDRGPRRHRRGPLLRSDALANAFAALIDGRELSEGDRLVTIAAVKDASKQVNEEYDRFRREQGMRD